MGPMTLGRISAKSTYGVRSLRTRDHPGEHVAPEAVRAEPVLARRRLEVVEGVRHERVLRDQRLAEDRAEDPEPDDDRAGDERLGAREHRKLLAARTAARVRRRAAAGGGRADERLLE